MPWGCITSLMSSGAMGGGILFALPLNVHLREHLADTRATDTGTTHTKLIQSIASMVGKIWRVGFSSRAAIGGIGDVERKCFQCAPWPRPRPDQTVVAVTFTYDTADKAAVFRYLVLDTIRRFLMLAFLIECKSTYRPGSV